MKLITRPIFRPCGIPVAMSSKTSFGSLLKKHFAGISIQSARTPTNLEIAPHISTLHKGNAYWMANFSRLVYWHSKGDSKPDDAMILDELNKHDQRFISVTGYDKNGSQAMLVVHKNFMAMVFRGTDELIDWLNNIKLTKVDAECGTFHGGFFDAFNEIWSELRADYLELQSEQERPLFITGHSLGGALAGITAAHCLFYNYPFVSVYTFGQPRALMVDSIPSFNAACGDHYFRFQRHYDLVGYIPTSIAHFGHVGQCIYIDAKGNLHNDPGWWFKFLSAVESALDVRDDGWVNNLIINHRMRDYLNAVSRWQIGEDWGF